MEAAGIEPPSEAEEPLKEVLTLDEMKQKLAEAQQTEMEACSAELQVVLRQRGFQLAAVPTLVPDAAGGYKITASVVLVPVQE